MKTLIDLYLSASKAAEQNYRLEGVAAIKAKAKAFDDAGITAADETQWTTYYDEQVARYATLSKSASPSAKAAKIIPATAPASK